MNNRNENNQTNANNQNAGQAGRQGQQEQQDISRKEDERRNPGQQGREDQLGDAGGTTAQSEQQRGSSRQSGEREFERGQGEMDRRSPAKEVGQTGDPGLGHGDGIRLREEQRPRVQFP